MLLSVIIPVYNGQKTISKLVEEVQSTLNSIEFEMILVNDGSKDASEAKCIELTKNFKNISYISLRKNFGEFNAVICGLNFIKGEYAVIIDDDFQNPPSEILKLLTVIQEGDFDVVYSQYTEKKHSFFRNFGSWLVNCLTTSLLKKPDDLYLSSFKIIKKEVVEEICKYSGPYPYIDGLIFRITNNVGKVFVEHNHRVEGASNYTFRKLISLFFNIIFGYSLLPIRTAFLMGIIAIFASFLLFLTFFFGFNDLRITIVILFMGGVQLLSVGIIGEYIGKTFITQSNSPQFTIKKKILHDV